MHKAEFALMVVAIVFGTSAALGDYPSHTSIHSLKWQMRQQVTHMPRFSGALTPRYATSISNWTGCPANSGGYVCNYWAQ
jgi:hypothetical protein